MRIRWWGLLLAAVVGAAAVGVGWFRAAEAAARRVAAVNAQLARARDAAIASAGETIVRLGQASDSLDALQARLAPRRRPLPLPPLPQPGTPDERSQLRAGIAARDQVIADQATQLGDARTALDGIRAQVLAARDTVGALRQRLADAIPAAPCPPPLEPPRLPRGLAFGVALFGVTTRSAASVAVVAELAVPLSRRVTVTGFGGAGVDGQLVVGGRVTLRLLGR